MNPRKNDPGLRRGFTLIELLVVIGIMLVLIVMVAAGVRHTRSLALRHETDVELKICQDVLNEYRAINGYKYILGDVSALQTGTITLPSQWMTGQFNSPMFVYPKNNGATEVTAQVNNPASTLTLNNFKGSPSNLGTAGGFGSVADTSDPNNPRWASDAVRWSQGVMFILLKDPKNRALISKFAPDHLLENMCAPVNKSGDVIGPAPPAYPIDAALPLDGWGNPIIFVPPGGMHVWSDPTYTDKSNRKDWVIRTSGMYDTTKPVPPVGPNDHPFFASAGPDGYFTHLLHGDDYAVDNLYSFQSQ